MARCNLVTVTCMACMLLGTACRWLKVMLQSQRQQQHEWGASQQQQQQQQQQQEQEQCCNFGSAALSPAWQGQHEDALWGWWQQQGLRQKLPSCD